MNKKSYDLYGIKSSNLDDARELVEGLLDVKLVEHESGFHCGIYFRLNDVGQEHLILQKNYDTFELEWMEEKHQQYPILLYANETDRSIYFNSRLLGNEKFVLLKHQEI